MTKMHNGVWVTNYSCENAPFYHASILIVIHSHCYHEATTKSPIIFPNRAHLTVQ